MANEHDAGFALDADGSVRWQGAIAAKVVNDDMFHPRVHLIGDLGDTAAREAAQKRIETWLAEEAGRAMRDLKRLKRAVDDGVLTGLVRGIAWRIVEAGGVVSRTEVREDLASLSPDDRKSLGKFAIRIGTYGVWLPSVLKPRAMTFAQAFAAREGGKALEGEGLRELRGPAPSPKALAAFGRQLVGRYTVPVEQLEVYADLSRKAGRNELQQEALDILGWNIGQVRAIRSALRGPRRDDATAAAAPVVVDENNPFAALMALKAAEPEAKPAKPRREKKPKKAAAPAAEGEAPEAKAESEEAPKKKRRRRRGKGKGEAAVAEGTEAADVVEGAEGEAAVATDGEAAPKKKRRRRRKGKGEAAAVAEGGAVSEGEVAEGEAVEAVEGEASTDPAKKKRRRRRGRKSAEAVTTEGVEAGEAAEATEATSAETAEGEGAAKKKRRRRSRKPKTAAEGSESADAAPEAPAASAEPSAPEPSGAE